MTKTHFTLIHWPIVSDWRVVLSVQARLFTRAHLRRRSKRLCRTAGSLRPQRAGISAREVIVTTGGYTDRLVPALHRAFLPIATYVMITEQAA